MADISMSDKELLQFAIENGIIDKALLEEKIEMQKRAELLEKHPYKIWEGKNGKWYTYLQDSNKAEGRRLIKRNTVESLENKIIEFYRQAIEEPHFDAVFFEWINKKLKYKEISVQTCNRYEADFNSYLKGTSLCRKKIKDIDENFLEDYIKTMIAEKELTAKKWSNL